MVTLGDRRRGLVRGVLGGAGPAPGGGVAPPPRLGGREGGAPATKLEEAFGVKVDSRGAQTVGGLLIQALGRIPRPGGRFFYKGLEFDVLAASATRVERVAVRPGGVRAISLDRPEESG